MLSRTASPCQWVSRLKSGPATKLSSPLLVPQRDNGIHFGSPARRQTAGREGDCDQWYDNPRKGDRIRCGDIVQDARENASRRIRNRHASQQSDRDASQPVAKHQTHDIGSMRAQIHTLHAIDRQSLWAYTPLSILWRIDRSCCQAHWTC
jgi:hypothetical protein